MDNNLLTIQDVIRLVGLSAPTIRKLRRERRFPRAIRLGSKKLRWKPDEIARWMSRRPRE